MNSITTAGYEICESTVVPGTWIWALWEPSIGMSRNCVAARQGFTSPAEAMKDLHRFRTAAASEVIVKPGKLPRKKAS